MSGHPAQSRPPRPVPPTLEGKIVTPAHERFDDARRAWNLAIDQRPAAGVFAESAHDVAAAVGCAIEYGLQVAPQGTGHNAGPLGSLEDTILLKTERMRGVQIDPVARSPASRPACCGSRSSRPPPGTVSRRSPGPRPTSASSATRSAAG